MKSALLTALAVIAAVLVLGLAGHSLGGHVIHAPEWRTDLWSRLQYMLVFTILIERTVEVYPNAAYLNGDDRYEVDAKDKVKDATKPATIASIVISILIAVAGLRLMETIGDLGGNPDALTRMIWSGTDIIISAGLMAGGSSLFHEVAEALRGGIRSAGQSMSPKRRNARKQDE